MIFKKLWHLRSHLINTTYTYLSIGKDILDFSLETVKKHRGSDSARKEFKAKGETGKTRKNFNIKTNASLADDSFIQRKQQSLRSSQIIPDRSPSHHGPGNPGERANSNMAHRNYDNHQGN